MTDEERNQIIGGVVSDLAESKRTLACLEAKAEAMSLEFGLIANWLGGHFPSGVTLKSTPSVPEALALVDTIKETKERVEHLEERRAQLGV